MDKVGHTKITDLLQTEATRVPPAEAAGISPALTIEPKVSSSRSKEGLLNST
jgi:hypothetical protein